MNKVHRLILYCSKIPLFSKEIGRIFVMLEVNVPNIPVEESCAL